MLSKTGLNLPGQTNNFPKMVFIACLALRSKGFVVEKPGNSLVVRRRKTFNRVFHYRVADRWCGRTVNICWWLNMTKNSIKT